MRQKFKGLEALTVALPERTGRLCNNPACELCDVYVKPSQVLRKGGQDVCPRCLEPLVVQRLHPRAPTLPFKPGRRRRLDASRGRPR